ncbi:hypothetical protein [Vibrio phage vB_VpS_CC6]|nr:hypothetical protein [Vibrio phage vB_VpS_CC6]
MKILLICAVIAGGLVSCDQVMTAKAVKTCEAKKQAGELSAPFNNCDILKF